MLTLLVMIFAGCADTYKWGPIAGGDKDAVVENNGGLAVKQGEYIYYINGRTATSDITKKEDNTFGKVTKGAIMRGKLDDKGNVKDPVIVVPLMSLSSNKEAVSSYSADISIIPRRALQRTEKARCRRVSSTT